VRLSSAALAFGLGFLLVRPAAASVLPGAVVDAVKTTVAPKSADPADPGWTGAAAASGFANFTTETPAAAGLATTARLVYDDTNVYVGFVAVQRDVAVTAQQRTDDVGAGLDDSVTFAADTSGNGSRTYAFTATPLGTKYEYSSESSRYAPPWSTVATRTPDGYAILMTIPLADMRLAGGATQRWRVDFSRRIAALSDLLTWAYDPAANAYCQQNGSATLYCNPSRWPTLANLRIIGGAKRPPPYADVYGLASAGGDRNVFETTPTVFSRETVRHVGLDATVPVTRTLAFVGALGPDFSNVEADQTTIAPQEFQRSFTEYRPFFAQGSSFLTTVPNFSINNAGYQMFYTPSLGIVDAGYKLEGTVGNSAIGALDVNGNGFDDRALGYRYRTSDRALTLSAQGVDADHPGIRDRTFGFGIDVQNQHSGFEPIAAFTQETGTLAGSPRDSRDAYVGFVNNHGLFQDGAIYREVGPRYGPIDGFTNLADVRGPSVFVQYNGVVGARSPLKTISAGAEADRLIDRSGAAHQADASVNLSVAFKNLLVVNASSGTSALRAYADGGYPTYAGGENFAFDQTSFALNYADGTPNSADVSYSAGSFAVGCPPPEFTAPLPCATAPIGIAPAWTQQLDATTTRTLRGGLGVTIEYGGTRERPYVGIADSQWLRRLSLSRTVGYNGTLALSFRTISGTGGFALPGTDLAISYQKRYRNQNRLYVEYGSPGSYRTLQRLIFKYVLHVGAGGAGT